MFWPDDYIDKILCGDCLDVMFDIPDESIDLIITSPPYWNQRQYAYWPTYKSYMLNVQNWIGECARALKPGRHCFWIIPDKLPWPPKENGTKERLYKPIYADTERIARKVGFICEFPIIWDKRGPDLKMQPWSKKMWGSYPYPIGIIHTPFTERICVWKKRGHHGLSQLDREDSKITSEEFNDWARDIWSILQPFGTKDHPAPFNVEIPIRLLKLWSKVNDVVLDPFMGSGTTAEACINTNRHFIGIEISEDYCQLARNRIGNLCEVA